MNSVHELGPNGDSETISSRKIRSKTKPGARAPSWPSWHAQARAWPSAGGRIMAESRPYRGRGPGRVVACMAVSQAPSRPCCRAAILAPPVRARVARLCAYAQCLCRVAGTMSGHVPGAVAVLQYSPAHSPCSHVTIHRLYCDTTLPPTAF